MEQNGIGAGRSRGRSGAESRTRPERDGVLTGGDEGKRRYRAREMLACRGESGGGWGRGRGLGR